MQADANSGRSSGRSLGQTELRALNFSARNSGTELSGRKLRSANFGTHILSTRLLEKKLREIEFGERTSGEEGSSGRNSRQGTESWKRTVSVQEHREVEKERKYK